MLGLIARVLDVVEQGSGWHTDTEAASAFTARVGHDPVQGTLRERHDETDRLTHMILIFARIQRWGSHRAGARLAWREPATPHRLMSVAGSAIPGGTVIVR
jgi:hypothetical protein